MSVCQSCGGVIGRDCFNPSECAWITQQQEQQQQQELQQTLGELQQQMQSPFGMSLRDYFAAKAMAAILTHRDAFEDSGETSVARMAYNQADAMLEIRAEHDEAVAIAEQLAGGVQ